MSLSVFLCEALSNLKLAKHVYNGLEIPQNNEKQALGLKKAYCFCVQVYVHFNMMQ